MLSSTFNGVTFLAPERSSLAHLKVWYEGLEDSEVKRAIVKVRWRESKDRHWFRVYVLVQHPNLDEVTSFRSAQEIGMTADIGRAALKLLNSHESWILAHVVPKEATIDGHDIEVSWWPEELPPADPDILPPQERAEYEIESNTNELLYLVHLAAQPLDELVKTLVGSNTPFMCAGLIAQGSLSIMIHCPADFADSENDRDQLHDRILEYPSDFIILLRLAEHFGCQQPIVMRVKEATRQFCEKNRAQIPAWLDEYKLRDDGDEEDVDDRSDVTESMDSESYMALDKAGDAYKEALIQAVQGHESEIAEALNEFLISLPIPDSPLN